MHIPTGETVSQEIIAFRQALEQEAPDRPYDRNRWLYVPDHYSEYRYLLGTLGGESPSSPWGSTRPPRRRMTLTIRSKAFRGSRQPTATTHS